MLEIIVGFYVTGHRVDCWCSVRILSECNQLSLSRQLVEKNDLQIY